MVEYELHPGIFSEVMQQSEKDFKVTPLGLWRGMWPVGEDDYLEGDRIKVQLLGMHTTKLIIGDETMEGFPESFQEMYDTLRAEYGWGDLVFNDRQGNVISARSPLEGQTFKVREVIHRLRCATAQFPGEPAWVTIHKDSGREIKQWIEKEVQASCKVMVISRKVEPCPEEVDPWEICDDAQFGITLLEPLPEVRPVDHTLTKQPNFR
jgi:hypothetical protein